MTSIPRPPRPCIDCGRTAEPGGIRCATHRRQENQRRRAAYHNPDHQAWRKQILHRDYNRCVLCTNTMRLQAHHINHNPNDRTPSNGVTLCQRCHMQLEAEYQRGKTSTGPLHTALARHIQHSPHHQQGTE